ncbi:MAG: hypothetical protein UT05_C0015G0001 [Parcubacteria group bacterium GW2011_GWF2_38_76]|nr:MAG: hypothetical protein UT05_C0015G0001 [Parcubacteria group bacterium GW2011_GWF2_38_76]
MNSNTCNQCGECCKLFFINLNEEEYRSGKFKTIFDGLEAIDDYSSAAECGANFLAKKDDGSCIYLDNSCCSIHKSRPQVCRSFFCDSTEEEYQTMREIIKEAKRNLDDVIDPISKKK